MHWFIVAKDLWLFIFILYFTFFFYQKSDLKVDLVDNKKKKKKKKDAILKKKKRNLHIQS
jgi:hypothetical protein